MLKKLFTQKKRKHEKAIFYFTNPIKPGNSNLRPAWNKLMRPFSLETLTSELMDQIEAVTQIYQIEREQERRDKEHLEASARRCQEEAIKAQEQRIQRRQNIFNIWLSTLGIMLTALSVVAVKPSDISQFIHEWYEFFVHLL